MDLIRRAETANFKALVVTVDTPLIGNRLAFERNNHLKCVMSIRVVIIIIYYDYYRHGRFSGDVLSDFVQKNFDDSLTWNDIDWIKQNSKLPIVIKGILRPDDAEIAIHHGVAGIVVSNHGGRQLDGVLATVSIFFCCYAFSFYFHDLHFLLL